MMKQASCYDDPKSAQYIWTQSGRQMFYDNPKPSMISIQDIAHALSNLCRWSGQTKEFYSIAQHCVLVSQYKSFMWPLDKLMHDASEAYTGDINKPLKNLLGESFLLIETRLEMAIVSKYGLNLEDAECHKDVKEADLAVALAEAKQLLGQDMYSGLAKPAQIKIEPWDPRRAEAEFLDRFQELM